MESAQGMHSAGPAEGAAQLVVTVKSSFQLRSYMCIVYLLNNFYSTITLSTRGQILSPRLGDIVDSGIELSYRHASLCSLDHQPM
jgi:hypothetical protein